MVDAATFKGWLCLRRAIKKKKDSMSKMFISRKIRSMQKKILLHNDSD